MSWGSNRGFPAALGIVVGACVVIGLAGAGPQAKETTQPVVTGTENNGPLAVGRDAPGIQAASK
jgi:hypothetical protein